MPVWHALSRQYFGIYILIRPRFSPGFLKINIATTKLPMKKRTLILLLGILFETGLFAQNGSWGEFPMIPSKSFAGRRSTAMTMNGSPAYAKVLKVYERLREARGDFRFPVPQLIMSKDTNELARIAYGFNEVIYFGEKAFNVCEQFGDQSEAAIAFLLGHELTHYYEKHAWRSNFASQNDNLSISLKLGELYEEMLKSANPSLKTKLMQFDTLSHEFENVAMEAQSDYLGGFLAYSAGYGTFNQGDLLIERLYKAYHLPDVMPGYVTREEREAMSKRSAGQMKDLVEVFEMANLLTAIGQYEEAYRYYRKVLAEYQSREVYNNVGATAMLNALKYFKEDELKFRYPVQLDLDMANSRGASEDSIRTHLLKQAIQHFDAAISLDPDYAPAYINKACALALLGDDVRAYYYADVEARRAAVGKFAKNRNDVEIILGILDAKPNTKEAIAKAKARLTAIAAVDKTGLAAYNLAKLNNQAPPPAPEPPADSQGFFPDETIDEQDPASILFPETDKMLSIDDVISFVQNTKQGPNSRLYVNRRSSKNTATFLSTIPTADPHLATARGVKIGSTQVEIEQKYGWASRAIQTPTGQIMVYDTILFIMKDGKLERWVLYKTA